MISMKVSDGCNANSRLFEELLNVSIQRITNDSNENSRRFRQSCRSLVPDDLNEDSKENLRKFLESLGNCIENFRWRSLLTILMRKVQTILTDITGYFDEVFLTEEVPSYFSGDYSRMQQQFDFWRIWFLKDFLMIPTEEDLDDFFENLSQFRRNFMTFSME